MKASLRRRLLRGALALVLAGILCFGVLFGIVCAGERDEVTGEEQVMVILGCKVMPGGSPSILLRDRLDKALEYLADHPDMTVVVSGGQGGDEPTSEAQCMANYLTEQGIDPERILLEEESHNTWQNLNRTAELLAAEGYDTTQDMIVVSSGFHLSRARMLWGRVFGGAYNLSTLAAPASHRPSKVAMYIREPLALVKSFLFDRG